jgi:hypothetical protein
MSSQWHVSREGKSLGVFSSESLAGKITSGEIKQSDFVWKEGMAEWISAEQLPSLFPDKFVRAPAFPKETARGPIQRRQSQGESSATGISEKRRKWTIVEIVASSAMITAFFTPLFLISAKYPVGDIDASNLKFGWSLWFSILCLVLGIFALGTAIARVIVNQRLFLLITDWSQVGLFGVSALASLIGVVLFSFGIGVYFYLEKFGKSVYLSVAEIAENTGDGIEFWFIPIVGPVVPIAAGLGLLAALLNALRKE